MQCFLRCFGIWFSVSLFVLPRFLPSSRVALNIAPKFALTTEALTHFRITKCHKVDSTIHFHLDNLQRKYPLKIEGTAIKFISSLRFSVNSKHCSIHSSGDPRAALNQRNSHLMFEIWNWNRWRLWLLATRWMTSISRIMRFSLLKLAQNKAQRGKFPERWQINYRFDNKSITESSF